MVDGVLDKLVEGREEVEEAGGKAGFGVGAAVVFDAYVEVGKVDDTHGLPGVGGLDGFLVAWEGGSRSAPTGDYGGGEGWTWVENGFLPSQEQEKGWGVGRVWERDSSSRGLLRMTCGWRGKGEAGFRLSPE